MVVVVVVVVAVDGVKFVFPGNNKNQTWPQTRRAPKEVSHFWQKVHKFSHFAGMSLEVSAWLVTPIYPCF